MKKYLLFIISVSLLTISSSYATDNDDVDYGKIPNRVVKSSSSTDTNIITGIFYTLHHKERNLPVTYDGRTPHDGSALVLRDWNDYKPDGQWRNSTLFAIEPSSDSSYYTLFHKERGLPVTYDGRTPHDGSALVLRDWNDYKLGGQWRNSTLFSFIPSNYKLYAVIEDFEYQQSDISKLLNCSGNPMSLAADLIIDNDGDIKIEKTISQQIEKQETVSWSLTKSNATRFSHNASVSIMAKASFLGAKWGASVGYQFGYDTTSGSEENNTKVKTTTEKYTISDNYTIPPRTKVKISQMLDWVDGASIPFSAKIKFTAKADRLNSDGSIASMSDVGTEIVKYFLKHEGYKARLTEENGIVFATVDGVLKASYGIRAYTKVVTLK